MKYDFITEENREDVNKFLKKNWHSTDMIVRGEIIDMTTLNGIVVYEEEKIIALVTYRIENKECEIVSLDSLKQNQGIGTELVERIKKVAEGEACKKVKVITTNDNTNAIRFYQKRGFDMVKLYHNAVNRARQIKPSIPLLGDDNILIKHEIEFEFNIY